MVVASRHNVISQLVYAPGTGSGDQRLYEVGAEQYGSRRMAGADPNCREPNHAGASRLVYGQCRSNLSAPLDAEIRSVKYSIDDLHAIAAALNQHHDNGNSSVDRQVQRLQPTVDGLVRSLCVEPSL